jgi:hypothetical protein
MNGQSACYKVCLGRQHIAILSDARDLTGSFEFAQTLPQSNKLAPLEGKLARDVGLIERAVVFPSQKSQDLFLNITSVCGHGGETMLEGLGVDVTRFQSEVE